MTTRAVEDFATIANRLKEIEADKEKIRNTPATPGTDEPTTTSDWMNNHLVDYGNGFL